MGPRQSKLSARLQRLRREEGVAPGNSSAPRGRKNVPPKKAGALNSPDQELDCASALGRLRQRLEDRGAVYSEIKDAPDCPTALGAPRDLEAVEVGNGICHARIQTLNSTQVHGCWKLDEAHQADARAVELLAQDASLASIRARDAIFLDTETTGLSGGSGTWVYMVGLGRFLPNGSFEMWQGFLRGPEAERPFMQEVARRIAEARTVVSFFGKSYDQHRLLDRLRLNGLGSPFEGRPHLDLYYPLKRLLGGQGPGPYGDHKLQTLEDRLCGHKRVDDLPGSAAPEAWFDFLAQRPHRLEGVFQHNFLDVLSLVTLFGYLGRALTGSRADGRELAGSDLLRNLALMQSSIKNRQYERALGLLTATDFPGQPLAQVLAFDLTRGECLLRTGAVEAGQNLLHTIHERAWEGRTQEDIQRVGLESAQILGLSAVQRGELALAVEAHGWAADWLDLWPGLGRHRDAQLRLAKALKRVRS